MQKQLVLTFYITRLNREQNCLSIHFHDIEVPLKSFLNSKFQRKKTCDLHLENCKMCTWLGLMWTRMEQKRVNTEVGWLWEGLWRRGGWGANQGLRCFPDSASCSGQCNLRTPSRGGCSSARGPRVAGGPWDPWQKQQHPLHRESPWPMEQPPGPGSCFPLKDRTSKKIDLRHCFVLLEEEKGEIK